jgi:hypothetical protein
MARFEGLGDRLGPAGIALDDLDVVIAFQLARQVAADVAAAGENDAPHRVVQRPQLFHHGADVALGCEEEHRRRFPRSRWRRRE